MQSGSRAQESMRIRRAWTVAAGYTCEALTRPHSISLIHQSAPPGRRRRRWTRCRIVTVTFCGHGVAGEQEEPRNSKDAAAETFLAHWMI